MAMAKEYPTYCASIIERRDQIFFSRMRGFFEQGRVIAFLGASHCRGIRARLVADGYTVRPPAELS
jgi:pheromone shutdown protein TraB